MSRHTWINSRQGAALLGISTNEARALWLRWQARAYERPRCTAAELETWCRKHMERVPPLVVALLADEREWPRWLADLEREWAIHSKRLAHTRKRGVSRLAVAQTWDEAIAIAETLPDLDARGRLEDEGDLPPETDMRDHWGLAGKAWDDGTE